VGTEKRGQRMWKTFCFLDRLHPPDMPSTYKGVEEGFGGSGVEKNFAEGPGQSSFPKSVGLE
jgi:hypothetical protein